MTDLQPVWGRRIRLADVSLVPTGLTLPTHDSYATTLDSRVHLVDPVYDHVAGFWSRSYATCLGALVPGRWKLGQIDEWRAWVLPVTVPITCFRCLERELETQYKWRT